jgi:hypothetical protein
MSKSVTFATLLAAAALLSACQAEMLSDDRIIFNTSGVIGVPAVQLTISDRRSNTTDTYYTAHTKAGATYACVINGGGALALGMVDPPSCSKITGK